MAIIPGKDYVGAACGALIFNEKEEIFMMLRGENTRNDHGMWGLPGGLIELHETVEEAVRRETNEECGIIITGLTPIGYADHFLEKEGAHFISQLFVINSYDGIIRNNEPDKCDAIGWFPVDELPENMTGVAKTAIEVYKKQKNEHKIKR